MVLSLVHGAQGFLTPVVYATLASTWLATAGVRARALSGAHVLLGIAAHGALQLGVSFVLSAILYSSLYASLVPAEERSHDAHFLPCSLESSTADPFAWAERASPPPPPRQLAQLWFDTEELRESLLAGKPHEQVHTLLPMLAPGWSHSATICLTLPESPANLAAGTFVVSLELLSARNRTISLDSRALVRRAHPPTRTHNLPRAARQVHVPDTPVVVGGRAGYHYLSGGYSSPGAPRHRRSHPCT
jgi:hypothetical protein